MAKNYSKDTDDTHNNKRGRSRRPKKDWKQSKNKFDKASKRYEEEQEGPTMKNPNIKNSAHNDAAWYTYSPEVLKVASAVNFNQATGVPFSDASIGLAEKNPNIKWWPTSPSLMSLDWTPLPGMALSTSARNATNSPLNLQMRSLYSLMQATVTQNLPFAAADLGIHLMFMDSIFMFWGHMQRLYYLFRVYKAMNTTIPRVFFNAYGLNPDNLFVDGYTIADYQADMLSLQQEIRRIAVPDGFDILNRHYWMSKHVFKDADVVRAQYYMFVPKNIWYFDPNGATGGELVLHKIPEFGGTGIQGLIVFFRQLLTTYYNDENIWNLNGYILRAFNKFWVADDFQLDAVYEPQYVPEVLMQIHNATIVGDSVTTELDVPGDFNRIYQDSMDNVVCDPAVVTDGAKYVGHIIDSRILFDTPTDVPSEGDIMVASRLIARGFPYEAEDSRFLVRLDCFGTEIINSVRIEDGVNYNLLGAPNVSYYLNVYDEGSAGEIVPLAQLNNIARLSKFNSAPMFPLIYDHTENNQYKWGWFDYIGDIENFVVFEKKTLTKLHDAAAMGEWYIKQ